MKKILYAVFFLVALLSVVFMFRQQMVPAIGHPSEGARLERLKAQPNFKDGRLRNDLPPDESLSAVMNAIMGERAEATRPDEQLSFPAAQLPEKAGELAVTWLGHSTVILELEGRRILFDPMWSLNASPVEGVGPARYLDPPIALGDVPKVDAVIISHDHYDHLDVDSVQHFAKAGVVFVVPIGIGAHLEAWGVPQKQIVELGWWEEHLLEGLRIVCTPARHFSGREVTDRFGTLWAGWAFVGKEHRVFFSGDTGMGPHFEEIGKRLGPFTLSMFEVGSYDPAWPDVHLGPEQALDAHRASNGVYMLPVHWSAFVMGNHGWTEPAERLLVAATPEDNLLLPKPGERVSLMSQNDKLPQERWWPQESWRTAEQAPIKSNF